MSRVLGEDYVVLKGRGGRDLHNGATCGRDSYTHLGMVLSGQTACGKAASNVMATYDDVEIDCPDCIRVIKERR